MTRPSSASTVTDSESRNGSWSSKVISVKLDAATDSESSTPGSMPCSLVTSSATRASSEKGLNR